MPFRKLLLGENREYLPYMLFIYHGERGGRGEREENIFVLQVFRVLRGKIRN